MDRLREIFVSIWTKIVELLKNFENSSLFERLMRRYEGLTPRGQNIFKGLLKIGTLAFIAIFILGGPFMLLSEMNLMRNLEKLEADAAYFQADFEAQTRGYQPPAGWRPLSASSAGELVSAFNDYLPGIGVPEEFGTLSASGDTLKLSLRKISVRQATNILFQLEGLYPKVRTQSLRVNPNSEEKEILDLEASFQFNPAFANQVSDAAPVGPNDLGGEDDIGAPPPLPSGGPSGGPTPPPGNENRGEGQTDFQNDFVPPPPPPGDYDELAPPDLPDDMPPPPPPPGFEEEG